MSLNALLVCSDEKILRVLRRVLNDLEISADHCPDAAGAVRKLTRQRFEALIVDCSDSDTAASVLKSARLNPCNRRAVAVAIIDGSTGVRSAFEMGAHFTLYKPISAERAKTSFRAARALMKRERRRNSRLPVQIPISITNQSIGAMQRLLTVDFSEGGCAVQFKHKVREFGPLLVTLALPGIDQELETEAEVAWQSPNNLIGLRFINTNAHAKHMLKTWVNQSFPDPEKDDPPVCSRLTDLSLGGCYLQITTPFPVRTRVTLSMRIRDLEIRVEGVVRVAHHDAGMGIEFTRVTQDQRQHVATFIEALRENAGALPDLLVEPEGLESDLAESANAEVDGDDNLLELFRTRSSAPVESFMRELRQQRHSPSPDPTETILEM